MIAVARKRKNIYNFQILRRIVILIAKIKKKNHYDLLLFFFLPNACLIASPLCMLP